MAEGDWLAERFEENRPHLRAVAYRMLGSVSEADDAVQEAWLRLSRSDSSAIENLGEEVVVRGEEFVRFRLTPEAYAARWAIWIRLPHVSSKTAVVTGPISVGGWVKRTPRPESRSKSALTSSTLNDVYGMPSSTSAFLNGLAAG